MFFLEAIKFMNKQAKFRKQLVPSSRAVNPDVELEAQEKMAQQVKAVYTLERRLWEENIGKSTKSNYKPHPKYEGKEVTFSIEDRKTKSSNEWLKAVKVLLPNDIHPVIYVRVIFRSLRGGSQAPPYPGQLVNQNWIKFFHEKSTAIKEDVHADFTRQCDYSKNTLLRYQQSLGYDLKSAMYYLINDEQAPLSGLYRYCLAVSMLREPNKSLVDDVSLFQGVAKRHLKTAALQYTCFPGEYDSAWKNFIPEEFSKSARQIYSGMISRCV